MESRSNGVFDEFCEYLSLSLRCAVETIQSSLAGNTEHFLLQSPHRKQRCEFLVFIQARFYSSCQKSRCSSFLSNKYWKVAVAGLSHNLLKIVVNDSKSMTTERI